MKEKNIPVSKLLLDSENPRHDTIGNQKEIISELLKNSKVLRLARDIAEQNGTSPLDTIGVIESGDEYIVVEGNRRTCALLLLHNPELCDDNNTKKLLKSYKKDGNLSTKVRCIVFNSREEADPWIKRRHGGAQDGVGTINWSAQQTAIYDARRGNTNKNIQAQRLLDYAVEAGIISTNERSNYSVTTLQRYLGNPVFRNALGLDNTQDITTRHTKEIFDQFVIRFLQDTIPDEDGNAVVNSRSKSEDWKDYANTLSKEIAPAPGKNQPPQNHSTTQNNSTLAPNPSTQPGSGNKATTQQKRSKPDPAKRKYLLSACAPFSINDPILQRIYQELKRLEIENFEFCTAFLIRAFTEKTAVLYLKKNRQNSLQNESKLHKKFQWIKEDLEEKGIDLKSVEKTFNTMISDKNSLLSPHMMGATIHGSTIPNKRELINIWDRLEPVLRLIQDCTQ